MTTEPTSANRPRAFLIAILLVPPVLALLLVRLARTEPQDRVEAHQAAVVASPASGGPPPPPPPAHPPFCVRLAPTSFAVAPGGTQELTVVYAWGGAGSDRFKWSANGGALSELGQPTAHASLEGFVMGDDFEAPALDAQRWKSVVPDGASIAQAGGVLTLRDPGGAAPSGGARIETTLALRGDFTLDLTLLTLEAGGKTGAAALGFRTEDGIEPQLRRLARATLLSIEAVTPKLSGNAREATAVFDPGGPAHLRVVRSGSNVSYQVDVGGSPIQVGAQANAISTTPASVFISAAALDERPPVTAIVDNFSLAQNLTVVWHAPTDAPAEALYTIKTSDSCQATARILRR